MAGKTMSDFAAAAREKGINLEGYLTDKDEDLRRIEEVGLPHFDLFVCDFSEFKKTNKKLQAYFSQHKNDGWQFCVRAIPTEEGYKRGYSRKPKRGLKGFEDSREFLGGVVQRGEGNLWKVMITNMVIQTYGGVIRNGNREIHAEIARDLERLTSQEENPLTVLVIDKNAPLGERITLRLIKDDAAELRLLEAVRLVGERQGYFEFVTCLRKGREQVYFLDYKIAPDYTKNL